MHPGTEFLRFAAEGNDQFYVETKTSTLGPGYHAFVVEPIDQIAEAGGIDADPAHRDWALDVLRSISPPPADTSESQ